MRRLLVLALCAIALHPAWGGEAGWHAGVMRIAVPDGAAGTFNAAVFYPTHEAETPWQAGPFTINATAGAPPATDRRFPVILFSHGRRGGPLTHRELAASLARAGFIVALPTHVGDASGLPLAPTQAQVLVDRPRQARAALDAVLAHPRLASSVDAGRIGMIGFSAGGYTALVLAGARPDFARADAYCQGAQDPGSCTRRADAQPAYSAAQPAPPDLTAWQPPVEPRIGALVLMDPLAVMFGPSGLSGVRVPTLLYRPESDAYLGAEANALAVERGLPAAPAVRVVPGAHFVFVDPCPPELASGEPLVCHDAPGVDRASIHREMKAEVARFLHASLAGQRDGRTAP